MRFRKLILSLIFLTLYACGNSDTNTAAENKATTEMPADIQKLTLSGGGTLSAYITVDGDTANRREMTIDGAGAGSASASIPGLSRATHTIIITYEYTDGTSTIVLATATSNVDLSSGSGSLSFAAGDYDLASFDADGDGVSNAAELAAGTDPRDGNCVLDTSVLGSCTLG